MCIRNICHNTYGDGSKDVTETVEPCTLGYRCLHPRIVEYDCDYKHARRDVHSRRAASHSTTPATTPATKVFPPTPRSLSPASPGLSARFDPDRRRPAIFTVPEPPKFVRPISIHYPTGGSVPLRGLETPPLDRGRGRGRDHGRPPAVIEEHASSARLRRRRSQRRHDDDLLSPLRGHRAARSPLGYASAEDDKERSERRRRRHEARERARAMPSSLPTTHDSHAAFGTSYGSSTASSYGSSTATNKKALRWEDEQRRRQNERIETRPKLSRSRSRSAHDVKSILKKPATPAASPQASPRPSPRSRRNSLAAAAPSPDSEDLSGAFAGLGIHGRDAVDDEYRERLRGRFARSPRQYTSGGYKQRTEVWYPEEQRYRYV